jgi:phenylacetate-CoA ligase
VGSQLQSAEPDRLARLNELLREVAAHNEFQRARFDGLELRSLEDLRSIAPTCKHDMVVDQQRHPPFGTNLTYPLRRYRHLHQTSGTSGATLRILDTGEDWAWWRRCFAAVLSAAGVGETDLVALAHSFGPYVQFWASYEGLEEVGAIALALGGMSSLERLQTILDYGATALICTPTYALHLARVACQNDLGAALDSVQRIVCTGEPGASLPAVRDRIEELWNARCLDHAGLSEVGSYGYPCLEGGGLHVLEDEFIPEVLDPQTLEPVAAGTIGELVITAVGRRGFPAIRYRTGDIVEPHPGPCPAGHPGIWLPGGIVGRSDDMVVIRGMNVFPSAIEQCMRELGEHGEFRITFYTDPGAMDEVKLEVELAHPTEARAIQSRLRQRLGLRIRIVPLKQGTLQRTENKTRRVVDLRYGVPSPNLDERDGHRG